MLEHLMVEMIRRLTRTQLRLPQVFRRRSTVRASESDRGPWRQPIALLAKHALPARTNKWGADVPVVPAGRLFDEMAPTNMSERIDRLLAEGHEDS